MMSNLARLCFRVATQPHEFEQIFRLNHATFVEEIPQHAPRHDARLIDRFHVENDYVICTCNGEVIGMVALRGCRPFSLDSKIADLDTYLPASRTPCEIRLLTIQPGYRHSRVLPGLIRELARIGRTRGYDYAVISGTTRQRRLYEHLGFQAFGPLVGHPGAYYQPMSIAIEKFEASVPWLNKEVRGAETHDVHASAEYLLPGPVETHESVVRALAERPAYHRSSEVEQLLRDCGARLLKITNAEKVQVLLGSGTLANDAIAQQLALWGMPGLILANGEFGERLVDHAERAGLQATVERAPWGTAFDFDHFANALESQPSPAWIWMVHCETSTGVLNDLARFRMLAGHLGAAMILDAISSLGNVDVDLADMTFAAGSSGKGLAAVPGLAFVFHRDGALRRGRRVPRYLDLWLYAQSAGVPFTHSSTLLSALSAALRTHDRSTYSEREGTGRLVRAALKRCGLRLVDGGSCAAAPFIVSVEVPRCLRSTQIGAQMLARGFRIAVESRYLVERNWIQFAWMGAVKRDTVLAAVQLLGELLEECARSSCTKCLCHEQD